MRLSTRYLRARLSHAGLLPRSKVALAAWYVLGLDLLLFGLHKLLDTFKNSYGGSLGGWTSFLTFVASVLLAIVVFRWLKARLLWRLRNRLIVTYVFIGVIPVILLVALALGSLYLFAGQFATFIVITGLDSELRSVEVSNSAIAHHLASEMQQGGSGNTASLDNIRRTDRSWADRQLCVWWNKTLVLNSVPAGQNLRPLTLPDYLKDSFQGVVRDHDKLYLRALETLPADHNSLIVLSSKPFDQKMLGDLAANLGEISLFATGVSLETANPSQTRSVAPTPESVSPRTTAGRNPKDNVVLNTGKGRPPTYVAGNLPLATTRLDLSFPFPTTVRVTNWDNGDTSRPAALIVQTRVSQLYQRLFSAVGAFASPLEFALLIMAVIFAVIELVALWVGTHLTRTVTGAVAQLYDATKYVNRADFSHRIPVRSSDQIATLANSFNSMTASLEKLIEEQKEKQRMENELAIAQEVQAQLFPREVAQLGSLEVHGFCRPARTVSGDYYDFLTLDSEKLLLAVGDISGKGISAALLMATIHSAVRAYSLEGVPLVREPATVGASQNSSVMLTPEQGGEAAPALLLSLLNHQLYESTPPEKYATLFLGIYDGTSRRLTYSNGGHLPPIVMSEDGSVRRLEAGGTVIGLFDARNYDEDSVQLRPGEIFVAFTDGVTEPENDFGEFGEQRLIEILRENRGLPLARLCENVTVAVDDWIGASEQPDDLTLVVARAR